ncbi:MAG: hypothetical protein EPO19_04050 [Betaproteobacteria bacterium]|nr:MAG: hypothetical protein EPO19_04050 [Betaproteobacteria bacterium]
MAIYGVLNTAAGRAQTSALRAPTVFWTKTKTVWGFIQDRRLRADVLFIRAQSAIRADGFSSAQQRNSATTAGAI